MEVKKREVGRPRSDDPKMKLDSIRLKTSTVIDIEVISEKLNMSKSLLVRTVLENEMKKYKELFEI